MSKAFPLLTAFCVFVCLPAQGQSWSDEQIEIWKVIEAQWQSDMDRDLSWPDRALHEKFLGWGDAYPVPRDKASIVKWNRYEAELSKTLVKELTPIGIVVEGDTAVAHYFFSTAVEDKQGEHKMTHGSYTDVLVKDGAAWKFLAWRGGEESGGD
jgi:hypothetical protein